MIDSLDLPSDSAYSDFVAGNGVPGSPSELPNLHRLLCDKPEMALSALLYTSNWSSAISNTI